MADIIGTRDQVDEYIGSRLVVAAYQGSRKYFDAYSDVTGNLPLYFNSRADHNLKNYRLYGTSEGAGVQTENLWDNSECNVCVGLAGSIIALNTQYIEYSIIPDGLSLTMKSSSAACHILFEVEPDTDYTISLNTDAIWGVAGSTDDTLPISFSDKTRFKAYVGRSADKIKSFHTAPGFYFIDINIPGGVYTTTLTNIQLTKGTTYIPPGYKIPLTVTSGVTENEFVFEEAVPRKYIDANGVEQNSSVTNDYLATSHSGYMAVTPNENYTFKADLMRVTTLNHTISFCWYDSLKTFIGKDANTATGTVQTYQFTGTAPANAAFCIMNFMGYDDSSKFMFVPGSTAPDHYIPHRYTADYNLYIGSTKLGAEEYLDYQEQKVWKRTAQLFDKSNALIGYRVASTGVQQNNSYSCSDYIEIVAGEEYKVSSSPRITNWYFYDNTKTYLSYAEGLTATAPATAKYVRVNISNINGIDTFMLTVSTEFPETYIPYLQPTDPPAPFPAITAYAGENVLSSTETVGEVTLTGRLAKTYRQVEYLESTGTQYIETDIVPTYSDAVETYLQFTAPRKHPAKQGVLGTIYDNRRYAIVLGLIEDDPLPVCFYCGYPWQTPDTNIQITANVATLTQKQKYYLSTTKFQLGTESKTPPSVSQSPPQKTFLLFAMLDNDGVAYPFAGFETMRCFGLTFSVAGVITHNLIPVERNSDGVLGMLDTITNKFYTNAGTGTFIKGGYV